tara:strand:+ start:396 stop:620 length:225 start_codon:yes stop_codon:yes gene_type:complete
MSESTFWISVWAIISTGVCVMTITMGYFSVETDKQLVKMVELGATPMEAGCALRDSMGDNISCNLIVNNKTGNK